MVEHGEAVTCVQVVHFLKEIYLFIFFKMVHF